jgi:chromosome segregation ATPase
MDTTQILYLAGAFLLGFIIAWFAGRGGPKRAAEEAAAETDTVRRKLSTAESDLRKTQGQLKENLATLDQLTADKDNLVKMLRTSEQGLSDAGAALDSLTADLAVARDANLLQQTELGHTRDALTVARGQIVDLTAQLQAVATLAAEASEVAETAILAEQTESEESAVRMADLESQLALARATAERLAEKEVLVSAEVLLRRREYRDVVTGGEDTIVAALAARDQALADAQTQLDYMRRDLSMLTAAGAQMAMALEQRNREYDTVRDRLVVHETTMRALPEISQAAEAAQTAAAVEAAPVVTKPDQTAELAVRAAELNALQQRYDDLRVALDQAIAERDELQGQLTAHQASVEELNGKVTEGQRALETLAAEKDDLLRKLSARAAVVGTVLAKISDFDEQLRSLVTARTQVENHEDAPAAADATTQEEEGETHVS